MGIVHGNLRLDALRAGSFFKPEGTSEDLTVIDACIFLLFEHVRPGGLGSQGSIC